MAEPRCTECGEHIRFNRFVTKHGRKPSETFPKGVEPGGVIEGWAHHHGLRTEHRATPPPGITGEDYLTRRTAAMDQAKMHVGRTLQSGYDYLNAQQRVNELFHDRRGD